MCTRQTSRWMSGTDPAHATSTSAIGCGSGWRGMAPLQRVTLEVDSQLLWLEELEEQGAEAGASAVAWKPQPPLDLLRPRLARLAERRPGLHVEYIRADLDGF